jgi:hypothetical protein
MIVRAGNGGAFVLGFAVGAIGKGVANFVFAKALLPNLVRFAWQLNLPVSQLFDTNQLLQ